MYPFRHPTPVEPTTSYTIGVALRHNTRLKQENTQLKLQNKVHTYLDTMLKQGKTFSEMAKYCVKYISLKNGVIFKEPMDGDAVDDIVEEIRKRLNQDQGNT